MNWTLFAVCAAALAAQAGTLDFSSPSDWSVKNYNGRLRVERAAEFVVRGATNACDTALSLVSRKMPVPADAREFVVSMEAKGTKLALDKFREGGDWNNATIWYGADGKKLAEIPMSHCAVAPHGKFARMTDWGKVPAGAAACAVRLGFDNPNLGPDDFVGYRAFEFKTLRADESREAEFAAAFKDGAWAKPILYPEAKRSVPKATLRDDGIALVDGKPFFPIGIYSVCKRSFNSNNWDVAFRDLKAAGFNFAHTYGNAYEPGFFDAAEKYGFKLWVAAKLPDRNLLDVGRHRPSVLAWYLGDDTSAWISVREVEDRHAAVKAVDPNRLTCQADPVDPEKGISNYAPYVRATDVFMPEIYPVRKEAGDVTDKTCVAKTIWDMERVRADVRAFNDGKPRACWPILQWFKGWGQWAHFPSREQLWATAYAAIVHGAHGIVWYTYGGFDMKKPGYDNQGITSTPERWRTISELATKLNAIAPVLVERTPAAQPKVEIVEGPAKDELGRGPSVTCLLKRHDGKDWLFAVNAAAEPVTARFAMPDGSSRTVKFAPLGVHESCR